MTDVFRDDLRLLKIRELRQLVTENQDALRTIQHQKGSRAEYFRRLYSYRLYLLRAELASRERAR